MPNFTELGPELDIYVVRHGQSTANADKLLQGWADYPLSEEGILQAKITGRYLANIGVKLDRIYTSPLSRARRTAEEIGKRFFPAVDVVTIEDLKEIDIGSLTDQPMEEAQSEYPDFFKEAHIQFDGFDRFGGESRAKFEKRVGDGLKHILDAHNDGESVLITAHGGTAIILMWQLFDTYGLRRILKMHNCFLAKIERRLISGQYACRLDYYITPSQQQLMLEGLGYMRGLTEEE
jgi:broad specificity phosphatase PhoE